jgi:hypothetical protein
LYTLINTTADAHPEEAAHYGDDVTLVEETFGETKYLTLNIDGAEFYGTRADWQKLADANLPALFKAMGLQVGVR